MKVISCVWFPIPKADSEEWRDTLFRLCPKTEWTEPLNDRGRPQVLCRLDTSKPQYQELQDLLRTKEMSFTERIEHTYTDAELRSFPLLCLGIARPYVNSGGPEDGTVYDLTQGCSNCGAGAVQASPLMMKRGLLPKKSLACAACRDQILVCTELANALMETGISGLELRQAGSHRNKQPLPWWQMIAAHTMPAIDSRSKSLMRDTEPLFNANDPKWGCPVCQRDMFVIDDLVPWDITYDREQVDLDVLPDVVQTWECFGRSIIRDDPEQDIIQNIALPMLFVKPKVFDVFRKLKVRHTVFEPVRIA